MVTARLKRGDVWLVNLDPTVGSEIRKTRPCVVISPPEIHDALRTAIVAPLTSKGFPAPFRIPVVFSGTSGLVVLDQLRTVDKSRLVKRLGCLTEDELSAALSGLQELFAS